MALAPTRPRRFPALPDLAAIRRAKGVSLRQIADETKITTRYLEAIERSDFDQLPGGIFRTSYIRQYARAIDYDECDLLACCDPFLAAESPEPEPPRPRGWPLLRLFMKA